MRNTMSLSPMATSSIQFSDTNASPLASACGLNSASRVSTIPARRKGLGLTVSFPLSRRKKLSRLLSSAVMRSEDSSMASVCRCLSVSAMSCVSSSALPLMAANGERSSCVMVCMIFRRDFISSSFLPLIFRSLLISSSFCLLSRSLHWISRMILMCETMSRTMAAPTSPAMRRKECLCASAIFCSRYWKAVCACLSSMAMNEYSLMFSSRL